MIKLTDLYAEETDVINSNNLSVGDKVVLKGSDNVYVVSHCEPLGKVLINVENGVMYNIKALGNISDNNLGIASINGKLVQPKKGIIQGNLLLDGKKLTSENDLYMIGRSSYNEYALFSLFDGNRFVEPVNYVRVVGDPFPVDIVKRMCGSNYPNFYLIEPHEEESIIAKVFILRRERYKKVS